MAGSLNKALIVGRLGRDPELKYTQSGQPVCNISVATDESYKDQNGQKVEKTEWHRVQLWRKQAEFAANYLAKGRLVLVEGKLQTRKWQDKNGTDRYVTEIIARNIQALDSKKDGGGYVPAPDDQDAPPPFETGGVQDDEPF